MSSRCARLLTLFACLLFLAACTTARVVPSRFDATPRLAVISAFDRELEKLRAAAQIEEVRVINGRSHYLGKLAGNDVVLFLCGFSMTNAAMSTQAVLDHFNVTGIVFSGIAGGVNPELKVGDVAVPAAWGNYQEQTLAREIPGGWDPGRFAGDFANFGMIFPRKVSVTRRDAEPDQLERRFWFEASDAGLATVRQLARDIKLQRCLPTGECLSHEPRLVVGGKGVSGPSFVDNAAYRQWAWDTFHADALDMETAAVALVAYVNRIPYIAFRSLSDLAGGGSGENEAKLFGRLAADNSAAVVVEYLKAFARTGQPAAGRK